MPRRCRRGRRRRVRYLGSLCEGESARIVDFECDKTLCQRIMEMGLHKCEKLKMSKNIPKGPVLVVLNDSRIALDREVSKRIKVI